MKTGIFTLTFIAAFLTGISNVQANATYFSFDSLAVDSVAEEAINEDVMEEDSFPTEEQFKEITKKGDTTFITLGNKKIKIIEENGETEVKIQNKEGREDEVEDDDEDNDFNFGEPFKEEKGSNEFKGHWAGFEFGLNNYVNKDLKLSRSAEDEFMDVNTSKSWNFNLNFAQYSLGFGTDHIGLVTGMGFEWSNYHLNDSSIQKFDGEIVSREIPASSTKNKLQTTYLTIPLLLEIQLPGAKRDDRVYLSGGVIAGIKLFSFTKYKYVENGINRKEKIKDDYYLSPLRYGFTARAGYKALKLYVNYYPTPLFMADRGPELYPVAAGLVVSF